MEEVMEKEVNNTNQEEKGQLSVTSENIFPIIKKWLYSDKEIFVRELVSNAVDAINKLKSLKLSGEFEGDEPEFKILINIDKDKKTLSIKDNGIGMTTEEVKKYINQIAFSGAEEFLEKYKDGNDKNQIIGHFGLGFYSSFMVSKEVEIKTLSYKKDANGVHWSCKGSTEFSMTELDIKDIGTEIILHLLDEEEEFLNEANVTSIIRKYCNFLPFPIEVNNNPANDQTPLWVKMPNDTTEDDYKEFYRKLFPVNETPLFWIHLNVDYPFRLKGILYFPKLHHELDTTKGEIKLYCNQVYVAGNIKELIPEFLTILQGAIDCPDIPLNVSRSYLQNDPYVKKISGYIVKKIADKLKDLSKSDSEKYHKVWEDINPFVKFGMMKDEKFFEKMKNLIVYKNSNDEYTTIPDYLERNKDKQENKIYYASDKDTQIQYINLLKEQGVESIIADSIIDSHFIQYYEMKESEVKFERVDSDLSENLVDKDSEAKVVDPKDNKTSNEKLETIFKDYLKDTKGVEVKVETLKSKEIAGMIVLNEGTRRMKEMTMVMGGKSLDDIFSSHKLVVNSNHNVVKKILELSADSENNEVIDLMVHQVYDLSLLTQKNLKAVSFDNFIKRSTKILELIK